MMLERAPLRRSLSDQPKGGSVIALTILLVLVFWPLLLVGYLVEKLICWVGGRI